MRRPVFFKVVPCLCVAALAACATPQATAPPPAPAVPVLPGPQLPPRAEELGSYPLVQHDPAVVSATAGLAAAPQAARPAALMRRADAAFSAAVRIRSEKGGQMGFTGWSPERDLFNAYCDLALRDLGEVLSAHPQSAEAARAAFTAGQINDYPNLNQFDEALAAYRLTVEHYPGTPWAGKARERIAVIEGIFDAGGDGSHRMKAP